MCVPCGPRGGGCFGREAFKTLDYCDSQKERKIAKEKYPDNEAALEEIKAYISDNIDHTEKWIINEIIYDNRYLAYIWAEEENRLLMHKFYLKEKRKQSM